ncbi:hypothetical protein PRIPAC_93669 [Pristionchus pacificus]|uniref:Uncharacterized protein n=1 Tax=Pristionchus pacificus TaxID=54126 RepID=A0A2A6CIC9_PRIPA|nr:hypothetical protein PRIPAC_93669 [Pristionchus pacificus]|eukprot:PDM77771.1 hypothetical protein PRIPAC_34638 [Pristionchus pacificus]
MTRSVKTDYGKPSLDKRSEKLSTLPISCDQARWITMSSVRNKISDLNADISTDLDYKKYLLRKGALLFIPLGSINTLSRVDRLVHLLLTLPAELAEELSTVSSASISRRPKITFSKTKDQLLLCKTTSNTRVGSSVCSHKWQHTRGVSPTGRPSPPIVKQDKSNWIGQSANKYKVEFEILCTLTRQNSECEKWRDNSSNTGTTELTAVPATPSCKCKMISLLGGPSPREPRLPAPSSKVESAELNSCKIPWAKKQRSAEISTTQISRIERANILKKISLGGPEEEANSGKRDDREGDTTDWKRNLEYIDW